MNEKHTPGPWRYQEESDAYTHIVRPDSNPGRIVASCGQDSTGTSEANARLIAATPDLLEALNVCAELMERIGRTCQTPECMSLGERDAARELARAAIAKATGKS